MRPSPHFTTGSSRQALDGARRRNSRPAARRLPLALTWAARSMRWDPRYVSRQAPEVQPGTRSFTPSAAASGAGLHELPGVGAPGAVGLDLTAANGRVAAAD